MDSNQNQQTQKPQKQQQNEIKKDINQDTNQTSNAQKTQRGVRDAAFKDQFYGVPLKKMQPKDEQDLLFKLKQQFTSTKDLLNFYEANRYLFEDKSYIEFFKKLIYELNRDKTPEMRNVKITQQPQFKMIVEDYAKTLNQKSASSMINDEKFLNTLSPQQLAKLLLNNTHPEMLGLTIKNLTICAHKIGDILSRDEAALANLQPIDLFNIVTGFGKLHLVPHSKILYLIEPFISLKLNEFSPDQLNLIATHYIKLQRGLKPFLEQLLAYLSVNQAKANLSTQEKLLQVLDPSILYRNEFKLDVIKEVRVLAKEIIKNINQINYKHLLTFIPRFLHYQIGTKAYYEILAIQFVKDIDKYNFKQKSKLLYMFALVDIDQSYIFKTLVKLCQSYSEAFIQRDFEHESPPIGVFTDKQISYIEEAKRDLERYEEQTSSLVLKQHAKDENKIVNVEQHLEFDNIQQLIKITWSLMVFTHQQDSEQKQDITDLWTKLLGLLNQKLKRYSDFAGDKQDKKFNLSSFEQDMIYQINNFIKFEMSKYGVKNAIKLPKNIQIDEPQYKFSSVNHEKEYLQFISQTIGFLKVNSLFQNQFHENYRVFGGANLDQDSPLNDRVFVLLNQKHQYFEDTKAHNAFVKIRSEHMKKVPSKQVIELDFYDYLDYKKKLDKKDDKQEEEEDDKSTLFSLTNERSKVFDQCDRCREQLAAVECIACGVNDPIKFCYECDNTVHQISFKSSHKRNVLQFNTLEEKRASIEKVKRDVDQRLQSSVSMQSHSPTKHNKSANQFQTNTDDTFSQNKQKLVGFQNEALNNLLTNDSRSSRQIYNLSQDSDHFQSNDNNYIDRKYQKSTLQNSTIKEKDQEILKLKRANDDLELQISKQSIQTQTIQRELSQIESINQAQIDQLQQSVKYYQSQVDKMRLDQSSSLKTVQERHDQEKLQLRQDYEVLINSIRTEYQQQKNEIREQLRNVEVELERKKQDYLSLKNDFEKRFDSLRKEMERMEKHFSEDQRGHSIALTERVKTEQINKELDKENRILNSEIQLMEDEVLIFKQENKELKNQVKRLEKMVYGKSNSISRKK
eukprot:403375259